MISDRGEINKTNAIAKWEGKIGKSTTLSKLFTNIIKIQWGPLCIRIVRLNVIQATVL